MPFEIPDSWEWVRLGSIGETNIGLTYKPTDVSQKGIAVMRSNNIQNGSMDYSDVLYVSCEVSERAMSQVGDILICARNGSRALVGKSAIIDKENLAFGAFMAIYRSICNPYVQLFINSYLFRGQLDGAKTTTINQVTQTMLKNQLCPLPPLAEQLRIVKTFENITPTIDAYKTTYSKIEKLNTDFPEQLKKSILQWAVQGKLEPQDENDEPASVLLERIREEKAQLIKDKKIKKDKAESIIFKRDNSHYEKIGNTLRCIDDEIPFDIPDSWEWCRLNTIGLLQTGTTPSTTNLDFFNGEIPFIKPADILNENINYSNETLTELGAEKSRLISSNSVLMVCIGGSMGKCATNIRDVCCNQQINAVTPYCCEAKYLMYVMCTDYLQTFMKNNAGGTATPIYNKSMWGQLVIPLPPLAEQQRIVEKIETVLSQISNL